MIYKKKIPNLSRILNQLSQKIIINNFDFYQNSENKNNGSRKETDVRVKIIKKNYSILYQEQRMTQEKW